MIPLTALINVKPTSGPQTVERFNNFQAAKFMGNPATGYSSGQAMTAMEEVAKEVLPDGYTIAWSGLVVSGKAGQQRRFSRFRARAGHGLPDPRPRSMKAGRSRSPC